MNEIVPIIFGVAVALVATAVRSRTRQVAAWLGLSVAFGLTSTVLTGEAMIGWDFLVIDIPLVAASAVAGGLVLRSLARRTGRRPGAVESSAGPDRHSFPR